MRRTRSRIVRRQASTHPTPKRTAAPSETAAWLRSPSGRTFGGPFVSLLEHLAQAVERVDPRYDAVSWKGLAWIDALSPSPHSPSEVHP